MQEDQERVHISPAGPIAADLPPAFVERMGLMLGDRLAAFLDALATPAVGLRVNTLRLSPEEFLALSSFDVRRLSFPLEGFTITADDRAGKHPYHAAGLYYLQDPGAMVVGALIGAAPGERVLDLSAAPGGKATHLAAAMRNTGVLVANDVSRPRAQELVGNLERCGVRNAIVLSETVERLARHFGAYFDRVLVDAPCSGESMFHKSAAARADWSVGAVQGCARRQSDLLREAGALLRPGGLMVYSTCTFSREENEEVVARFLGESEDFEPAELPPIGGSIRETEADGGVSEPLGATAYRLWPHEHAGAGHYVAGVRRTAGGRDRARTHVARGPDDEARKRYREFADAVYARDQVGSDRLEQRGTSLYALPADAPSFEGLRVVRAGVELGFIRTKRFEPAHAMAMAYPVSEAVEPVLLPAADARVDLYLRGHPIDVSGPSGWVPVAVDGYALGWGKRVGRTIKNHYPKGLRWAG